MDRNNRDKERDREHERERRKKGLPDIKKEHLSGNYEAPIEKWVSKGYEN